jgi:hypothetical protein
MISCNDTAQLFVLALLSVCPSSHMIGLGMALGAGVYGMFMLTEGFFVIPSNIPAYVMSRVVLGSVSYVCLFDTQLVIA